jgi:hypothetical protein
MVGETFTVFLFKSLKERREETYIKYFFLYSSFLVYVFTNTEGKVLIEIKISFLQFYISLVSECECDTSVHIYHFGCVYVGVNYLIEILYLFSLHLIKWLPERVKNFMSHAIINNHSDTHSICEARK